MKITHSSGQTAQGPADWFTGAVFLQGETVTWLEHVTDGDYHV